jgi:hypothetical protein
VVAASAIGYRSGRGLLVAGMVRANRPWRLMLGLSSALAAALATSAFGLTQDTIWLLADALGPWRLSLVALGSIATLVVWLIADHELWERRNGYAARLGHPIGLYNAATVITVLLGVVSLYVALLVLNFLARRSSSSTRSWPTRSSTRSTGSPPARWYPVAARPGSAVPGHHGEQEYPPGNQGQEDDEVDEQFHHEVHGVPSGRAPGGWPRRRSPNGYHHRHRRTHVVGAATHPSATAGPDRRRLRVALVAPPWLLTAHGPAAGELGA